MIPSTISSSVIPFSSCLQSFLASGSFQMSLNKGICTGNDSGVNQVSWGLAGMSPPACAVTDRPCGLQGFPKSQITSQTHPLSASPTFTMEPPLTMILPGPVRECMRAFFSCMAWRAIPGPLSKRKRRLDSLESAQGAWLASAPLWPSLWT